MSASNGFRVENRLFYVLVVFVTGLSLFWVFRMMEIWNNVSGNYAREITVEGEGSAFVVPDTAVLRLGVHTEGESSEAVVAENNEKMGAVMAVIEGLGIEKNDVKTVDYYLYPMYSWSEDEGETLTGYSLDHSIEVRSGDFDVVNELLVKASEAGANTVSGVSFEVDNPEAAKAEAREEAIAQAKEKAEQISESSGLEIGKMVNYWEWSYNGDYGKGGGGYMMESMDVSSTAAGVEPGEREITITVSLTYKIR